MSTVWQAGATVWLFCTGKLDSLWQISAKNREWHSSSSLALCLTVSSLRSLLSAHNFQTFIHVFVALAVFFTTFSANFFIFSPEISGNLAANFFFKSKANLRNCVQCCPGNLVMPSIFAITPLFQWNSDTLNQSNLWYFSAYTLRGVILTIFITVRTVLTFDPVVWLSKWVKSWEWLLLFVVAEAVWSHCCWHLWTAWLWFWLGLCTIPNLYSSNYFQWLNLESLVIKLEHTPLKRYQQLSVPYKQLIH